MKHILHKTRYLNETRLVKLADFEFDNCFLKFGPELPILGKFIPETSKCFVLNEIRKNSI